MNACVVIPTLNACDMLAVTLESLDAQTSPTDIVVVDNASNDGTREMLAARFPRVLVVENDRNLGFGEAVNRGIRAAPPSTDVVILVNNDVDCEPDFVNQILAPFEDETVGMVAGVLLQEAASTLVDSAGIELDATLRSYDAHWNEPVERVSSTAPPVGPCGGAAAYRADAFRALGGFDPAFFAYWEDVDLALRFREAGWSCASAPDARAIHLHGQTVGAGSPTARALDAFGRGFVLGRYREGAGRLSNRMAVLLIDWPALLTHLVVRRELRPIRERARGLRAGRARRPLRAPQELATVSVREAIARQWRFLALRLAGRAPRHFGETEGVAERS